MFEDQITVRTLDTDAPLFSRMTAELAERYDFRASQRTGQLTGQDAFPTLYTATSPFYRATFAELFDDFVPLYHSIWKHTTHSAAGPDNLHQDAGVQYFTRNGYQSRMINVWICLDKSTAPQLPSEELGLYVIDHRLPENQGLYKELMTRNLHVTGKSPTALIDNMHVGGESVHWNLAGLRPTPFPYRVGTAITFSSHLLHGSKSGDRALSGSSGALKEGYRIALSSVWLHRDDLNTDILAMAPEQYDALYLWRHEKSMWPDLKRYFHNYCEDENRRIGDIKALIGLHMQATHCS